MAVKTSKRDNATQPDMVNRHDGYRTLVQTKLTRVKVGGVSITSEKAPAAQVKQAIATSADMLDRLGKKIAQPGVQIRAVRDIPLFFADPEHPGRFLRKLNGKIEGGVLENGSFKVGD